MWRASDWLGLVTAGTMHTRLRGSADGDTASRTLFDRGLKELLSAIRQNFGKQTGAVNLTGQMHLAPPQSPGQPPQSLAPPQSPAGQFLPNFEESTPQRPATVAGGSRKPAGGSPPEGRGRSTSPPVCGVFGWVRRVHEGLVASKLGISRDSAASRLAQNPLELQLVELMAEPVLVGMAVSLLPQIKLESVAGLKGPRGLLHLLMLAPPDVGMPLAAANTILGRCVVRDSNSGHQLLLPPTNCCRVTR